MSGILPAWRWPGWHLRWPAATRADSCFCPVKAIGGTGDTLTGMLSVLCGAEFELTDAAILAGWANRWSGHYADPSPATQVIELIEKIPQALVKVLNEYNGKNANER